MILDNQNQVLIYVLKGLNLMMQLNQDRLSRHLPIHAEGLIRLNIFSHGRQTQGLHEALTLWPNRSSGVESPKLYANKILHLIILDRSEEIIHATPWKGNLWNNMELISRLME